MHRCLVALGALAVLAACGEPQTSAVVATASPTATQSATPSPTATPTLKPTPTASPA